MGLSLGADVENDCIATTNRHHIHNYTSNKYIKGEQMRTYRMSGIGHCPRRLSAEQLGYEPTPSPAWLDQAAKEGKWHELRIIEELKTGLIPIGNYGEIMWDVSGFQNEYTYQIDNSLLVGHTDGILSPIIGNIQKAGIRYVLEVKSMSQYAYDVWIRDGFQAYEDYAA